MKKIGIILLILIIIVFNFVIGANEKGLRILPNFILLTLIIIYLIVKKIKEPEKSIFFKSKIDCLVLAFMLTTTLPFVFKTYCSYSDTVEFILKYFFIYSVYILARNVITEKKDINYIINATLICSLIPVILGLDYINGKYLLWIVEDLRLLYSESYLFPATFGYPNTLAVYMALCLFLSIYQIQNCKNKVLKIVYVIYGIFITYIIWITISKAVIALLTLTLIIYVIIGKRKEIAKHWKKSVVLLLGTLIVLILLMTYALQVSEPFMVVGKQLYGHRIDYDFKPETEYTLELDIKADVEAVEIKHNAFELQIVQSNKYFKESKIATKRFGKTDGKLEIKFTPEKNFSHIDVRIINDFYCNYTIRKCYINGEEYIINYKYLPNQLAKIFTEYTFDQKGLMERMYIYKDCLKIAQGNWLIGQGGDTWGNLSTAVQEYTTVLKETHSYFFELLISYGIVGVVTFLAIIITLFVKIFKELKKSKEKRKEKLLIFVGLFFVLIHSIIFDFNMSFQLIQLMVYIYIAVLLYDEEKKLKTAKVLDYIVLALLLVILGTYARANIAKYFVEDYNAKQSIASYKKTYKYNKMENDINNNIDYRDIINTIKELMNSEPYYKQTAVYRRYFEQICKNIEGFNEEELEEYLGFGINKLKTIKFSEPLFVERIIDRTNLMKSTIEEIEKYETKLEDNSRTKEIIKAKKEELKNIINDEYETNIKNLEDTEKLTIYYDSEVNIVRKEYLKIINKMNEGKAHENITN